MDLEKHTEYWKEIVQLENYNTTTMYKALRKDKDRVEWKKIFYNKNV